MSLAVDPRVRDDPALLDLPGLETPTAATTSGSRCGSSSGNERRARLVRHVVTGLPTTSGRHGGCRLLLDSRSPALFVGTGDAADPANPRNLTSLGGKVLRVHRRTGAALADNPYADASDPRQRLVFTYGHRNVQGLAQRPSDGAVVSVEHGSYRDDEVNALSPGADFGWNPGPGYDESVPMTDQSLPGQQTEAIWSSGDPTDRHVRCGVDVRLPLGCVRRRAGRRRTRWRDACCSSASTTTLAQVDVSTPALMQRYGRLRSVTSTGQRRPAGHHQQRRRRPDPARLAPGSRAAQAQSSQRAPAITTANQPTASSSASTSTATGRRTNQRQPCTSATTQTSISSATTHHGRSRRRSAWLRTGRTSRPARSSRRTPTATRRCGAPSAARSAAAVTRGAPYTSDRP